MIFKAIKKILIKAILSYRKRSKLFPKIYSLKRSKNHQKKKHAKMLIRDNFDINGIQKGG